MPPTTFPPILSKFLVAVLGLFLARGACAQTPANLTDIGITAPTPGSNDISQLNTSGDVDKPDGLNYYTDNGVNHPTVGEPGQTFTTGATAFALNSVAFKTGGGAQSNLSTNQSYLLHLYSVNGGAATLIATYTASNFVFTNGDWLRWSGLATTLAANSTYAYSFGRTAAGSGYAELYNASNNPYPGGQIALIPPAGGTMTFGASHDFDGVFDLGLTPETDPSFPNAVLADHPVGYWRLNETGSTSSGTLVAVDSANGFNGIYGSASADDVPGPAPSLGYPGFETGKTGAEFTNGMPNSFVTVPALNLNTNTVTITTWVYPIGTPGNYSGIVFCRNGGDASGFCFTDNGQIGYTWNQNNSDTWSWMSGLVPPVGTMVVHRAGRIAKQRRRLSLQCRGAIFGDQCGRQHRRSLHLDHSDRR